MAVCLWQARTNCLGQRLSGWRPAVTLGSLPVSVCVSINTKQTNAAENKSSTEENDCLSDETGAALSEHSLCPSKDAFQ